MKQVLHFTDKGSWPIEADQPILANDGGWYVATSKQALLESYAITFTTKNLDDVRRTKDQHDECDNCHYKYPLGSLPDTGTCTYCSKEKDEPIEVYQRKVRITFLVESSKNTAIEDFVDDMLERYSAEVLAFERIGSTALADAINNETDETFLYYLGLEIAPGFTVKQSILQRIDMS